MLRPAQNDCHSLLGRLDIALNEPSSVLLRTAMRASRKGCTVHRFQRICRFLIMRFDRIMTAPSTKAVRPTHNCRREIFAMIRKDQFAAIPANDMKAQGAFIESLFDIAA
jgi:hypothetical protein